jgi:hypothetical protein
MNLRDAGQLRNGIETHPDAARVYGEPYETGDGSTVIPVAKPVGVFVVKDGNAVWHPAVDVTRIAMMGIMVGLVSATLAGLAMARRPPWPDLVSSMPRRVRPAP